MAISIVREERDGIEFFTVEDTGESGMSVSGLAKLCGFSQQAVSRLLNQLTTGKAVKGLENFASVDFQLTTGTGKHNRKIVKDSICAAVIGYYAIEHKKTEAMFSLVKFAAMGLREWIQDITGWTPERRSVIALFSDVVQREPLSWELHFSPSWIRNAERLTGYRWEWKVMSKFINRCVYSYMPKDVREARH